MKAKRKCENCNHITKKETLYSEAEEHLCYLCEICHTFTSKFERWIH